MYTPCVLLVGTYQEVKVSLSTQMNVIFLMPFYFLNELDMCVLCVNISLPQVKF